MGDMMNIVRHDAIEAAMMQIVELSQGRIGHEGGGIGDERGSGRRRRRSKDEGLFNHRSFKFKGGRKDAN